MPNQKPDWENLEIVSRNKEEGHAMAFVCDTAAEALARDAAPYRLDLNGTWRFRWIQGSDLPADATAAETDDSGWDEIAVPGVWQRQGYGSPHYYAMDFPQAVATGKNRIPRISRALQEIGVYRRSFAVPDNFAGRRVYLHFGAAKAALEVYLNGKPVGYSQGSMTPHEFDVTAFLTAGENRLTAVVWRYSDGTYLEDQDMWFMSGIYRDVFLYAEPATYLRDFYLRASFADGLKRATARLTLTLKNDGAAAAVTVRASIPQLGLELGSASLTVAGAETVEFAAQVRNPALWSSETPVLYPVLLELTAGGETTYKAFRFGFKEVRIDGNVLLLNGQPLKIRGVNRHDYDPDTGWTLSDARYREDIEILKRYNINALRTSHYPNDPRLYDLCDELGILVMDEADLESHGVRGIVPTDDPRWTPHCVDRMRRMVLRDRNHACIFFWSLGNEAGAGSNFGAMRAAAEQLDTTRPFHYEGEHNKRSTDVISRMYPDEKYFAKLCGKQETEINRGLMAMLAADKGITAQMYETMPVLLCEYAHSMENSLGNFMEYIEAFERYPHLCGGFIWDFADQAIRVERDGEERWLYGIDFAETYNARDGYKSRFTTGSNGYFCANGLVAADRKPHPAADEVRYGYQPFSVTAGAQPGRFVLRNKQLFLTPEDFRLFWRIEANGAALSGGEIDAAVTAAIPPLGEREIDLPLPALPAAALVTATFRWVTRADLPWAPAGTVQAESQIVLQKFVAAPIETAAPAPAITQSGKTVEVAGSGFVFRFSDGALASAVVDGAERLLGPLKPCYYRAETDNDRGITNFVRALKNTTNGQHWWRAAERQRPRTVQAAIEDSAAVVTVDWRVPGCTTATTVYRVFGDGTVDVAHTVTGRKRTLVRCGMELLLPDGYTDAVWLGRGPQENYPDRKTGALYGRYQSAIPDLSHNYMRPQENGARCDVFSLRLSGAAGAVTVTDRGGEGFLFTARHCTTAELDAAEHIHELKARPLTELHLDGAMCGVGGDVPGLLMLHEKYQLKPGTAHRAAFSLKLE